MITAGSLDPVTSSNRFTLARTGPRPIRNPLDVTDTQKIIELTIFKEFAKICPYKIHANSIEKRAEPEPDILCEVAGDGSVAFELGEIVDEVFARQVDGGYKLRQRFDEACKSFPALRRSLADAIVYIEFFDEVSDRIRLNCIKPILQLLHSLKPSFDGDVPVWKQSRLQKVVRCLEVHRGISDGPFFDLTKFVKHIDKSIELLEKKFAKSYKTNAPIELLAHFYRQPPSRDSKWIEGVRSYVANKLGGSKFRRVWIYNWFDRQIVYVSPEL